MLKDFLKHTGRIADATGDAVVEWMTRLHPGVFENLLTDNGRQFCRMNSAMRRYCESRITWKHIWSSVHHHQTLGKLSAFQKGLKAFVPHPQAGEEHRQGFDRRVRPHLRPLAQQRVEGQDHRVQPGGEILRREGPFVVREARKGS